MQWKLKHSQNVYICMGHVSSLISNGSPDGHRSTPILQCWRPWQLRPYGVTLINKLVHKRRHNKVCSCHATQCTRSYKRLSCWNFSSFPPLLFFIFILLSLPLISAVLIKTDKLWSGGLWKVVFVSGLLLKITIHTNIPTDMTGAGVWSNTQICWKTSKRSQSGPRRNATCLETRKAAFRHTDKHTFPVNGRRQTRTHVWSTWTFLLLSALLCLLFYFQGHIHTHTHRYTQTYSTHFQKHSSSFHVMLLCKHRDGRRGTRLAWRKKKANIASSLMYPCNNYTMRKEDVFICSFQVEEVRQ